MTHQTRPNSWVFQDSDSATQLSYALQINPAPFTVSIPGENPISGSLEFVITNPTSSAITVSEVMFTLTIGDTSNCLTQNTAGISTDSNDTVNWSIIEPSSPVTSGTASYTLQPSSGNSYPLEAGASVVVQIFGFQTITVPGNSTISIKEVTSTVSFTSFIVTTFPTGFYFNSLAATVESGSSLVPVAQINAGSTVTLTWNSSVVDTSAFTIYYSNAASGQQTEKPSDIGEWTSPPLTADTVFTVAVTISAEGGQPLTAAMTTSVSVQNPSLIATALTTGTATVTGAASIGGALTAHDITATGATVNGALSANSLSVSGSTSVQNVSADGTLTVAGVSTFNGEAVAGSTVSMMQSWVTINMEQTYTADTDGFVVGVVGYPTQSYTLCGTQIGGYLNGGCMMVATGGNLVFSNGPSNFNSWGSPNCLTMPVPKGSTFMLHVVNGGDIDAPTYGYWVPLGKSGIEAASEITRVMSKLIANPGKAQPMKP